MAENDEVSGTNANEPAPPDEGTRVLPPDRAASPAATSARPGEPVLKTRWRDRAWSFRAMLAVALATLVIGGVLGGTVVALAGHDDHERVGRWGPGGPMMHGPGWKWRGPDQFQGGGPGGRWNDGPQPPGGGLTPYGQPTPSPVSPSP